MDYREKGSVMNANRSIIASLVTIGLVGAACHSSGGVAANTTPPSSSTASGPSASGYHPVIDPANFTAVVNNPWLPLKPGSRYVYEGVKDGEHVRDVTTVTNGVQ